MRQTSSGDGRAAPSSPGAGSLGDVLALLPVDRVDVLAGMPDCCSAIERAWNGRWVAAATAGAASAVASAPPAKTGRHDACVHVDLALAPPALDHQPTAIFLTKGAGAVTPLLAAVRRFVSPHQALFSVQPAAVGSAPCSAALSRLSRP